MMKINSQDKGVWIPIGILSIVDLNMLDKAVLSKVWHFNVSNVCYANNQYFADYFGVSKSTINKIFGRLDSQGFILRRKDGISGKRKIFATEKLESIVQHLSTENQKGIQNIQKLDISIIPNLSSPISGNGSYIKEKNIELIKKKSDMFEDFWIVYDKPILKEKCKKEWMLLSETSMTQIMDILKLYIQRPVKYRKNPLNFLTEKEWLNLTEAMLDNKSQIQPNNLNRFNLNNNLTKEFKDGWN